MNSEDEEEGENEDGVRPSSGAATPTSRKASKRFCASGGPEPAAAGGRPHSGGSVKIRPPRNCSWNRASAHLSFCTPRQDRQIPSPALAFARPRTPSHSGF